MSQRTPFATKLAALNAEVAEAAAAFERRWTLAALRRVSPDIAERLSAQTRLWLAATTSHSAEAVETQGRAMCRGYAKAVEVMSTIEPDAYVVGRCGDTGLVVVIGHCPATAQHAAQAEGPDAIWMTPDEVANLLPKLGGFATLAAIKKAFPGAVALADADRQKDLAR